MGGGRRLGELLRRRSGASLFAGLGALLGAVVLIGWASGNPWLKSLLPGWFAMQPLAAVAFILAGLALHLHARRRRRPLPPLLLAIALVAGSALLQHLGGRALGIDALLFADAVQAQPGYAHPGRVTLVAALEFLLFCLCLGLPRNSRRHYRRTGRLATLGLLIALLALTSYLFGLSFPSRPISFSTLPVPSALAFIALFAGVLLAQRDRNWLRFLLAASSGAWMARSLLPYLLGWPLLVAAVISVFDPALATPRLDLTLALLLLSLVLIAAVLRFGRRLDRAEAERAAAAAAMRASEARLAGIVGSAMDAIITIDSEQRILLFNNAAEQLFGCPAEQALGSSIDRFIPTRFRHAHAGHVRHFGETGTTSRAMGSLGALAGLRCDGSEFPIEASISQIEVEGQKLFTVILRDISERFRAESEIRRLNADLERRVEKRTAELAHANEALLRSNQELQQFAYIAAHDLQTPLRSISGFAQLLGEEFAGRASERSELFVRQLVENARRMQTLIHDLLAYSRLESQPRPFKPTDLREVLASATAALAPAIAASGAEIAEGPLPTVMGDRGQLVQLLQNLVENGLKYRSGAPPRIAVSAERQGGEWVVSVSDNGIGIAARHHEQIFEIFRRLHTPQAYPGTGIGLAISRRIVQHHGGRIWVESEPGRGSTFRFTLPAT